MPLKIVDDVPIHRTRMQKNALGVGAELETFDPQNSILNTYEVSYDKKEKSLHFDALSEYANDKGFANGKGFAAELTIKDGHVSFESSNTNHLLDGGTGRISRHEKSAAISEEATSAVKEAFDRAAKDGKITKAEMMQLETLRTIISGTFISDGQIDANENKGIIAAANTIGAHQKNDKGRGV
jgi:hypothetical protein